MTKNSPNRFILLISLLLLLPALAKDASISKHETSAKKLCEVYDPVNLKKLSKNLKLDEDYFKLIGDESRNVSDDSQFKAVFKKAFDSGNRDFVEAIQNEVSALLGRKWQCDNLSKFYSFSFSSVNDDPRIKAEVIQLSLKLSQDGYLRFNKKAFKYAEPSAWQDTLQKIMISKNVTQVEILLPKGQYTNKLSPLFRLLNKLRIGGEQVIIREY